MAFMNSINSAVADLESSSTLAIVILGFTGYFNSAASDPYNEELVPILLNLSRRVPIFYLIRDTQHQRLLAHLPPPGSLFHHFRRRRGSFGVYRDAGEYLATALQLARLATGAGLWQEWVWDWVNGPSFMPRDQFPVEP
jgi:hypothetical protein